MRCPFCGAQSTRVVDTRTREEGRIIRRRRECGVCEERFATCEEIRDILPMVIKRDGRRQPFSRRKIVEGMRGACKKRPVTEADLEMVALQIERQLMGSGSEVRSSIIADAVLGGLRALDPIGYVRFLSVHRPIQTLEEFMRELEALVEGGR